MGLYERFLVAIRDGAFFGSYEGSTYIDAFRSHGQARQEATGVANAAGGDYWHLEHPDSGGDGDQGGELGDVLEASPLQAYDDYSIGPVTLGG